MMRLGICGRGPVISLAFGVASGLAVLAGGAAIGQSVYGPTAPSTRGALAAFEAGEESPGGLATTQVGTQTADAFSQLSANMHFSRELDFKIGNGIFRKNWVSSPSSTRSSDGLGPLYNARACQACHLKDGRGHPPLGSGPEGRSVSMFLRLSIPPRDEREKELIASGRASVIKEPTYGAQLQELAIQGLAGEGHMEVAYQEMPFILAGGETVNLRKPTYSIRDLGYGALHPQTMLSPRMTPQMIGLGLLEAIPETDILAHEDPDDRDGDGISGRANRVWSTEMRGLMLGRFGWKAGQPTVKQQSAEAFAGDIGIGSWMVPQIHGDCMPAQTACREAPGGGTTAKPHEEINAKLLDLVAFYARNLAVPVRRSPRSPEILRGKKIFHEIGCARCHVPSYTTGDASPDEHLRGQKIWPYTDLLLHDMGDGLADGRPEGLADGHEWRTPPLWGIGLTEKVNGHAFYLHDGRARSLTEAILWHGGEAQKARDGFAALSFAERQRLIAFVNSL